MVSDGPARTRSSGPAWTDRAIVSLVLATAFYRFASTLTDPDLWGHVRFGQDTLAARGVVRADAYPYMSNGQAFLNHEWLSEVAFALAYGALGGPGLIFLKLAITVSIAVLLYRHLMRHGLSALRAGIVLILVCLVMLMGAQTVRPQLFTYLCFSLLLLSLDRASRGARRTLWLLPVLFAAWANLHGGWLAGLGVFFVWAMVDCGRAWLRSDPAAAGRTMGVAGVAVLSLAGTLCTPYGLDLWAFVLRIVTSVPFEIGEWLPLRLQTVAGLGYLAVLGLSLAGLAWSRVERRPEWLAVFGCMAVAPLFSARHTPLFALTAAVVAGEHVASAWPQGTQRPSASSRSPWPMTLVCAFFAVEMLVLGLVSSRCVRIDPRAGEIYPARAVALLRQSGLEGNLAIDYNWGEYAIWHLGPRIRVSVDGRWLEAYPEEMYAEAMRFTSGVGDWNVLIRRPETDLVLASKAFPVFNLMAIHPLWTKVYEDPISGVFARKESAFSERLLAATPPAVPYDGAGCFP